MKRIKNFDNFEYYMKNKTSLFVLQDSNFLEFKVVAKTNQKYWEIEQINQGDNLDLDFYIQLSWFDENIVIEPETTTLSELKEFISKEISNPMLVLFSKTFKNYIKD